jgi:hypothetical protein
MLEVRLGPSGDEVANKGTFRANLPVGRTNGRHAGNVGNQLAPDAATGSSTTNAQLSRDGSRGHEAVTVDQKPSLLHLVYLLVEELLSHSRLTILLIRCIWL